jgi:hypothetical protein
MLAEIALTSQLLLLRFKEQFGFFGDARNHRQAIMPKK